MSTAANLANLLQIESDINYYTQQQIYWSNKQEANSAKLARQVKLEEKWNDAYDKAMGNEREIKFGNLTISENNNNESLAEQYADFKVKEYDEELKLELADLDIEYDSMKTMYETLLEELRADKEGAKQNTQNEAQDTKLLGGG